VSKSTKNCKNSHCSTQINKFLLNLCWIGRYFLLVSTIKHQNNCVSSLTLNACIEKVTMVLHLGFGCIVYLISGVQPQTEKYMLTISSFPNSTCPNFKEMKLKCLGKRETWANCKHLYYVFTVICNLQRASDAFIHAASFSFNKVKAVLLSGILSYIQWRYFFFAEHDYFLCLLHCSMKM